MVKEIIKEVRIKIEYIMEKKFLFWKYKKKHPISLVMNPTKYTLKMDLHQRKLIATENLCDFFDFKDGKIHNKDD